MRHSVAGADDRGSRAWSEVRRGLYSTQRRGDAKAQRQLVIALCCFNQIVKELGISQGSLGRRAKYGERIIHDGF